MFFVGITGQFITLILTVCLPFMLLASLKPATVDPAKQLNTEVQKTDYSPQFGKINSFNSDFGIETNLQVFNFEFEELFFRKIHFPEFRLKWKLYYTLSSGNKAPPLIF